MRTAEFGCIIKYYLLFERIFTMKRIFSFILAALVLMLSLCSCKDKENTSSAASTVPDFGFTAVDFVSSFNNACPEGLTGIGELDASDKIDDNTNYAAHFFNDHTSLIVYTTPNTNKVQKAVLWLSADGMTDNDSVYKFGAYTKILLSAFVSDETEYNKAVDTLRLKEELPYMRQNTYENDSTIIYFSHDDTGLKILVMPIAAKQDYDDMLPAAPVSSTAESTAAAE